MHGARREAAGDSTPSPAPRRRGAYWTSTRAALQPLFHSTGLAAYHRITSAAVGELEGDLDAAAGTGAPVDMAAAMCNLALKARVAAAYGAWQLAAPATTMACRRACKGHSKQLAASGGLRRALQASSGHSLGPLPCPLAANPTRLKLHLHPTPGCERGRVWRQV